MGRLSPNKSAIIVRCKSTGTHDRFYRTKKLLAKKIGAKMTNEEYLNYLLNSCEKELGVVRSI